MNKWLIGILLFLLVFAVGGVAAHDAASIFVLDAWAMATMDAPPEGVSHEGHEDHQAGAGGLSMAFMHIENAGDHPISLLAVTTGIAENVQLHAGAQGMMIAAGETGTLAMDGAHIMLLELVRGLAPGDAFTLTLTFDMLTPEGTSQDQTLDVVVGVPVLDTAPAATNFVLYDAWVRPTIMDAAADPHAGHDHGDEDMPTEAPTEEAGHDHMMGGGTTAIYFNLLNRGAAADRLVAVSAAPGIAEAVEMHETVIENEMAMMQSVEGLDLPAGETVSFEPGGLHIMLVGLQRDLAPGDALTLTLTFASGAQLVVAVPVYDPSMVE